MARIIETISDRLNPILVYEMRQGVHNRILLSLLLFFIGILFVVPFFGSNQPWNWTINRNETIAMLMVRITFDFSILVILLFPVARFVDDLVKKDLIFLSTLSARELLWGKLLSGMAHTGIFYLVALPFIIVWSLCLEGSILRPLTTLLMTYIVLMIINMVCLGIMAGTRTASQAVWYGVLVFLYLTYGFYTSVGAARTIAGIIGESFKMPSGFAGIGFDFFDLMPIFLVFQPFVYDWTEFPVIMLSIIIAIIPGVLAFLIGTAFLEPPSANRMLPIRIGLSLIGLVMILCCLGTAIKGDASEQLCQWSKLSGVAIAISFMLGICERDQWSERIRKNIPKSRLLRLFVFPFYTGVPCALCWGVISLLVMLAFAYGLYRHDPGTYKIAFNYVLSVFSGTALCLCVSIASLILYRATPERLKYPSIGWMIPAIVLLGLSVMALLVTLGDAQGMSVKNVSPALIFNPLLFAVLDARLGSFGGMIVRPEQIIELIHAQAIVSIVVSGVLILSGTPWLIRKIKNFKTI